VQHTIIHQFDPERHVAGGVEGFIRDVLVHGMSDGRKFRVIGVAGPESERELGTWSRCEWPGDVEFDFMPVTRLISGDQHRKVPHSIRLAGGLIRYRPQLEEGIVHYHRAEIALTTGHLARRARRILILHGPGPTVVRQSRESFWRYAPAAFDAVERRAVRSSDRAYVMHAQRAAQLHKKYPQVVHASNWFDDDIFFPGPGPLDSLPVIGWAGRLEPPKDPLLAIATLARLDRSGVAFRAWLAGEGTLREQVRLSIDSHGLADKVSLLGVLSPSDLADRLRSSSVLLLSSLWEGSPRAVIEALACGVPVAASDVGDVSEIMGKDGGVMADRRTPEALADALRGALRQGREVVARRVTHLGARAVVPRFLKDAEQSGDDQ
jgi:glycosyltransferase involved in cell wall biosynthesis